MNSFALRSALLGPTAAAVLALAGPACASAQTPAAESYRAHLSLAPVTAADAAQSWGRGEASATLDGNVLEVRGRYRELTSEATGVEVRMAPPALRGPAIGELEVSGDREGEFEGRVELSGEEVDALAEAGLYLKLHAEQGSDGLLRGWLYPAEEEEGGR